MKSIGIVRKIDDLGRIVIPREMRRTLKIGKNEPLEMYVENDSLVLKKFSNFIDKEKLSNIAASLAESINMPVAIVVSSDVVATARISSMIAGEVKIPNNISVMKPFVVDNEAGYKNIIIAPAVNISGVNVYVLAFNKEKSDLNDELISVGLIAKILSTL